MYDNVEQVVVFLKNSKMTYCDVIYIKFLYNNKIVIRQDEEKYYQDTIVNFNNIECVEVLYRKEINQ